MVQIRGSLGSFVKYGVDPQEDQLKASPAAISRRGFGVEDASLAGSLTFCLGPGTPLALRMIASERGDYRLWFRAVAEAIRGGGPDALAVKVGLSFMLRR